ncbi:MAG: tetratricopeptide repeat protein [Candidatus Binataceae bacterium]
MREKRRITMEREDHIGDSLGVIFLDAAAAGMEEVMARLSSYLGRRITILGVEIVRNQVEVEVESTRFPEESERMLGAAEGLRVKGMRRSARAMLEEALKLDPLNGGVLFALGTLLAEQGDLEQALHTLTRARETIGERVDLIQALAMVSIKLGRESRAIDYLERALQLAPNDPALRRTLGNLKPKMVEAPKPSTIIQLVRRDRQA